MRAQTFFSSCCLCIFKKDPCFTRPEYSTPRKKMYGAQQLQFTVLIITYLTRFGHKYKISIEFGTSFVIFCNLDMTMTYQLILLLNLLNSCYQLIYCIPSYFCQQNSFLPRLLNYVIIDVTVFLTKV